MTQTRNKITWYGNIVLTIFGIILLYLIKSNPESASALAPTLQVVIGGIMAIISFYHASEGYTKGKYIDKQKEVEKQS